MAYVDPDFGAKKEFLAAVKRGAQMTPYNPSGMFPIKSEGRITIEGPHYPKPHRWYAEATVRDGVIVGAK